jgi:hypothetical protein
MINTAAYYDTAVRSIIVLLALGERNYQLLSHLIKLDNRPQGVIGRIRFDNNWFMQNDTTVFNIYY